jgi:GMP synthase-like glutamine amidotransferase
MKTICVLQHTEAEFLGLMEDHMESRAIRFQYCRPFVPGGLIPPTAEGFDGLIILGAGPYGVVSGPLLPSLAAELRFLKDFVERGLPMVGIGQGAILMAVAAGGGADEAPFSFEVMEARRTSESALGGNLPDKFPVAIYMRDRPVLPKNSRVLAEDEAGEPVVFSVGGNSLGFLGHPGVKSAMIEDLIMEFEETPPHTAEELDKLRSVQARVAEALSQIMVGIVRHTGWMDS